MKTASEVYKRVSCELMRDELIVHHLEFVRHILAKLVASLPDGVDTENLESAGILGLVEAAQQYDPSRAAAFRTFSYPRIRGAIIDELRRNCPLPQRMLQMIAKVRKATEALESPVTPEDIARLTSLSARQVEDCLAAIRLTRLGVWDEVAPGTHVRRDQAEDRPDSQLEHEESKRVLAECIQQLPENERVVVTMYYLDDLRLKEIGKVIGRSEARVSRILAKAEFRLKELVRAKTS